MAALPARPGACWIRWRMPRARGHLSHCSPSGHTRAAHIRYDATAPRRSNAPSSARISPGCTIRTRLVEQHQPRGHEHSSRASFTCAPSDSPSQTPSRVPRVNSSCRTLPSLRSCSAATARRTIMTHTKTKLPCDVRITAVQSLGVRYSLRGADSWVNRHSETPRVFPNGGLLLRFNCGLHGVTPLATSVEVATTCVDPVKRPETREVSRSKGPQIPIGRDSGGTLSQELLREPARALRQPCASSSGSAIEAKCLR
mmetsp:Transcript_12400/g.28285  ORF Transcript_12400/g.28285 Transcript_12400/m.28285 type:complete len:256 (+) Transcript_12400:321-1088(+)